MFAILPLSHLEIKAGNRLHLYEQILFVKGKQLVTKVIYISQNSEKNMQVHSWVVALDLTSI